MPVIVLGGGHPRPSHATTSNVVINLPRRPRG
jgi:hypothetical protein